MIQQQKISNLKMSRGYEQAFSQSYINGQQVHEKVFNMTIRETQTKIIMRYHLIPKTAFVKKTRNIKSWQEFWGNCTIGGNVKLAQPLEKTAWSFLKELKLELPCDPAIILQGIYPKLKKSLPLRKQISISKSYLHSHVHCSINHNRQDTEKNLSVC